MGRKEERKSIGWFSYASFNRLPKPLLQVTVTSIHLGGQVDSWNYYVAMSELLSHSLSKLE